MFLLVASSPYPQKFWGFLEYKPQWTLTLQGWFVLLLLIILIGFLITTGIQPFLALSRPIEQAEVLVVEGWINDRAIKGAIAEFKQRNYQLMITTGMFFKQNKQIGTDQSQRELMARKFLNMGLNREQIIVVGTSHVQENRTAASAIAVRDWLLQSDKLIKTVNLYSYDVHTRRSWLIFKRVLAPKIRVGAIAYHAEYYQNERWWTASEGVRSVIFEIIAYIYARFFWQYD